MYSPFFNYFIEHIFSTFNSIDSRIPADLIRLIRSNALDMLDHAVLIRKAARAGVRGSLLLWLTRFMVGYTQRVLPRGRFRGGVRMS